MADFDQEILRRLLRGVALAVPEIPAAQAWENRDFETPNQDGTNWVREKLSITSEEWAATNTVEHLGNYRLDVVVPSGSGTETLGAISDAVRRAYYPGLSLKQGDCTVSVFRAQRTRSVRDNRAEGWYYQPIVVSWRSFTTFIQGS